MRAILAVALTLVSCSAGFGAGAGIPPRVQIDGASHPVIFTGVAGGPPDGVDQFRGIRYGVAPVKERRFKPAELVTYGPSAPAAVDATTFGASCVQPDSDFFRNQSISEDCLFLNIWTPANRTSSKPLPVIVWIHGGGFVGGSGSPAGAGGVGLFDGTGIAATQNVVVVTINYRLGPLGFLVVDADPEGATGTGGMNGIGDQVVALRWISSHIANFGGDAQHVTVFGESAGGESTCLLAMTPLTAGLVQRSIVQSGPCIGPWGPEPVSFGLVERRALMKAANVTTLDGLKTAPIDVFSQGWPLPTGGWFHDARLLPNGTTADYLARGELVVGQLMIGANSFDGTSEIDLGARFPKSEYELADIFRLEYGDEAGERVYERYDPDQSRFNGSVAAAYVQSDGDRKVFCPSAHIARTATSNPGKTLERVYLYRYAHGYSCVDLAASMHLVPPDFEGWASHGSEIAFVFGNFQFKNPMSSSMLFCDPETQFSGDPAAAAAERRLSSTMRDIWGSFARTGDPGHGWAPLNASPAGGALLEFRSGAAAGIVLTSVAAIGKVADCEVLQHAAHGSRMTYT